MSQKLFKGVKILSSEQHTSLLNNGYYIDKNGNQVEEDTSYIYASKESVDVNALQETTNSNTQEINNIKATISNQNIEIANTYQTKIDLNLSTSDKSIVGAINEIYNTNSRHKYYHDITIIIKRFVKILDNAGTGLFTAQTIMGEINLSIIDDNPANYDCIEKNAVNGKTNDLYTGVLNYLSGKNALGIAAPGKILVDTKIWNNAELRYDVERDLRLFTNSLRIMEAADSSSPYNGKHLWATSFSVNVNAADNAHTILRPEEVFKVYNPATGTYVEQDNSMLGLVIITDKEMNYVYPTTPGQLEQSTITVESVADCVTQL